MLINTTGTARSRALPDLVISKIDSTDPVGGANDRVTLNLTVANQGKAAAGAFQVQVDVLDRPEHKTASVAGLAAGASKRLSIGPVNLQWNGESMLTVQATADSRNQVQESDETNNWAQMFLMAPSPWPNPPGPPVPPVPPIPPVPHPH